MWREQMRQRDLSSFDGPCQDLGVNAVVFATVMANAQLAHAGGVYDQNLMAPSGEPVVNVPGFATRFDGHSSRRRFLSEQVFERIEPAYGSTLYNLFVFDLAKTYLSYGQI
jgi:hypothetical protein